MNERIFDMARQSGATDEQGGRSQEAFCFTKSELSAFAELIVKRIIDNVECHASLFNTKEARQVCSWIVNSVKYDFGVKE